MNKLLIIFALVIGFSVVALANTEEASAMNKAELIDAIAGDANLSKADAKRALDGFVTATSDALKKGDRISLVGFGSFSISKRAARKLSKQDDLTPRQYGCLWLASQAPEWLHGLFCSTSDTEIIALMVESSDSSGDGSLDRSSDDDGRLDKEEAQRFLNSVKRVTTELLVLREDADLEGFGAFSVRENRGRKLNTVEFDASSSFVKRVGRNPQTGKEIQIAGKNVVKFKAGADLSKKVN